MLYVVTVPALCGTTALGLVVMVPRPLPLPASKIPCCYYFTAHAPLPILYTTLYQFRVRVLVPYSGIIVTVQCRHCMVPSRPWGLWLWHHGLCLYLHSKFPAAIILPYMHAPVLPAGQIYKRSLSPRAKGQSQKIKIK